MRDSEEDAPLFSDSTGEALNASAWNLVREATASATNLNAENDDLNDDPASMRWIEPVEMTPGTHKYVLMKVCDEEMERKSSSSGRTRGVRTTRRTFRRRSVN